MAKRRRGKKYRLLTPWSIKWIGAFLGIGLAVAVLVYCDVYYRICSYFSDSLARFGFATENVVVEGCEKIDVNIVYRHLAALRSPCIFALDIETIRRDLEAFPWARSAIVQRKLPSTLYVRVAERVPIALWQNKHGLQLIDAEGALLGAESIEQFAHLPTVLGEGAPPVTAALLSALKKFPQLYQRFVSAVWIGGRRWDVFLSGKICVHLPEENEECALCFLDTFQKNEGILGRPLESIDLRFPGKVIVRIQKGMFDSGKTFSPPP
jgi:cell division protein FtsQ